MAFSPKSAAPPPAPAGSADPRAAILRSKDDFTFRLADALTGVIVFGATGSGKTSGPARFLAEGYLASNFKFGGLVLCAKPEERQQWQKWAAATYRTDDLVIIDKAGSHRFNFLNWEQESASAGGGLTINVVALLEEIAQAIAGSSGGGSEQFWGDALRHLMTNAVDLCLFSGQRLSLPILRDLIISAPQTMEEVANEKWQDESACWKAMKTAAARKDAMGAAELADFTECATYFTREFPTTSDRTRSIITLMFSLLSRPFTTRPLRRLFCEDTNVRPEDCFDGKILIIDLPVQDFRLAGRVAALAWKYCFQLAVMRRQQTGELLRPVFLWADECQNFVTARDAEYQAVARSAGGCTVYLTQNRESLRRVLGQNDTVDSLLGNLQCKFFCQNSGETNEYAARLLGERWTEISHTGVSFGEKGGGGHLETAEQRRYFVDAAVFSTLKRGGAVNGYQVETIVYNGGWQYPIRDPKTRRIEQVPFKLLTLPQEG